MRDRFEIVKLPLKFVHSNAEKILAAATHDLVLLKQELNLYDIGIRGGFILDALIGKKPKDVDIFYVTKDNNGQPEVKCICDKLRVKYEKLKPQLSIGNYDIDWGHYGKNEIYQPIVHGTCGYLTQSLDFLSLFVLDTNGTVWTNRYGLHCFKNSIWEITPMTWMTYIYFMADKQVDFYDLYCSICLKILRHLSEGKARSIGPMTKELLENFHLPLSQVKSTSARGQNIICRFNKKELSIGFISDLLTQQAVMNTPLIIKEFVRICNSTN